MSFLEHAQSTRHLTHGKRVTDLQWWSSQLAGAPLDPLLHTDFPRAGKANLGHSPGDVVKVWSHLSISTSTICTATDTTWHTLLMLMMMAIANLEENDISVTV